MKACLDLRSRMMRCWQTMYYPRSLSSFLHVVINQTLSPLIRSDKSPDGQAARFSKTYLLQGYDQSTGDPVPGDVLRVESRTVGHYLGGFPFTVNVYALTAPGVNGATMIDCGTSSYWPDVEDLIKKENVTRLVVTHHHEDHSGNVGNILFANKNAPLEAPSEQRPPIPVFATPDTCAILQAKELDPSDGGSSAVSPPPFPVFFYEHLMYGQISRVPRYDASKPCSPSNIIPLPYSPSSRTADDPDYLPFALSPTVTAHVIPIPGHARDMVAIYIPRYKALFSADLYISKRPFYYRADESLAVTIESLKNVLTLCCPLPLPASLSSPPPSAFSTSTRPSPPLFQPLGLDHLCCAHNPVVDSGPRAGSSALRERLEYLSELLLDMRRLHALGVSDVSIARRLVKKGMTGVSQFAWLVFGGDVSPTNLVRSGLYGGVERENVKRSIDRGRRNSNNSKT